MGRGLYIVTVFVIGCYINSLLHVSALKRRHIQGVQYEPAELSRLVLNSLKMAPLMRRNM
jgi:hypothetical protein